MMPNGQNNSENKFIRRWKSTAVTLHILIIPMPCAPVLPKQTVGRHVKHYVVLSAFFNCNKLKTNLIFQDVRMSLYFRFRKCREKTILQLPINWATSVTRLCLITASWYCLHFFSPGYSFLLLPIFIHTAVTKAVVQYYLPQQLQTMFILQQVFRSNRCPLARIWNCWKKMKPKITWMNIGIR